MGDSSSDGRRACGQRHSLSRTSIPSRADTDANHTTTLCAAVRARPSGFDAKVTCPHCTNQQSHRCHGSSSERRQSEQIGMKEGGIDLLVMPPFE